jgi:hypothetical protein
MPATDPQLLAKLSDTVDAAHDAFNNCPIGDPKKLEFAKQRNKADNTYLKAINDGLAGNSAEIQQAAQSLDTANQAVKNALAAAKKTAEVLAALQQAVGFAIQLAKFAAVL